MNLRRMLGRTVAEYGDKTAVVAGDTRLTYRELDEYSNRFANSLSEMGIGKGDRVALMLPNCLEYIVIFFGVVKSGACAVPLDPKYKVHELNSLLGDCEPKALITDDATIKALSPALEGFAFIEYIISLDSDSGENYDSYRDMISRAGLLDFVSEPRHDDTAIIFYTSGASSNPRGVMLSHAGLVIESGIIGEAFGMTEKDVLILFALPMYHVFGMVCVLLNVVKHGARIIIVPGTGISIGSFFSAIEKEKATLLLGVPYIFALAVDMAEKQGINNDLSSLRLCSSSGDLLRAEVKNRFRVLFGHPIIDGLALTEAVCHVTCEPATGSELTGSVGRALNGWEVKVVDDDGREVASGHPGEIVVRGPIMQGYYLNSTATGDAIKKGWLYTGDIGTFDDAGNLFITGRKKDIIIVKGQNIYPEDTEEILCKHPGISEASVVGVPDRMRGELVAGVIKLKEGVSLTEQEVRKFCLEYLIDYKVPKQIIFVSELPRDLSGRVDKKALRKSLSIFPLFPDNIFNHS